MPPLADNEPLQPRVSVIVPVARRLTVHQDARRRAGRPDRGHVGVRARSGGRRVVRRYGRVARGPERSVGTRCAGTAAELLCGPKSSRARVPRAGPCVLRRGLRAGVGLARERVGRARSRRCPCGAHSVHAARAADGLDATRHGQLQISIGRRCIQTDGRTANSCASALRRHLGGFEEIPEFGRFRLRSAGGCAWRFTRLRRHGRLAPNATPGPVSARRGPTAGAMAAGRSRRSVPQRPQTEAFRSCRVVMRTRRWWGRTTVPTVAGWAKMVSSLHGKRRWQPCRSSISFSVLARDCALVGWLDGRRFGGSRVEATPVATRE